MNEIFLTLLMIISFSHCVSQTIRRFERNDKNLISGNGNITVVLYGHGELFLKSQEELIKSINSTVDIVRTWSHDQLIEKYPQYEDIWNRKQGLHGRPACMAMKSVLFGEALNNSIEGDWVVWMDSSRYFRRGLKPGLTIGSFLSTLFEFGLEAYPGTALCGLTNVDNKLVSRPTFKVLELDRPWYWFSVHFQNNFFAFRNTALTKLFIDEWIRYSLNPSVNCLSDSDDQAIFSLLVTKYRLPYLNMCSGFNNPDYQELKNISRIFDITRTLNKSDVIYYHEDFFSRFPTINWDIYELKGHEYWLKKPRSAYYDE